jgi:hypothetical protein
MALDVPRDFCEVAIVAEGRLRSTGRIQTRPDALPLFARSLDARDRVAFVSRRGGLPHAVGVMQDGLR